ncbi:hypothetical protein U1Q18_001591, partial [Sarracenia purpurea var. burkii]
CPLDFEIIGLITLPNHVVEVSNIPDIQLGTKDAVQLYNSHYDYENINRDPQWWRARQRKGYTCNQTLSQTMDQQSNGKTSPITFSKSSPVAKLKRRTLVPS